MASHADIWGRAFQVVGASDGTVMESSWCACNMRSQCGWSGASKGRAVGDEAGEEAWARSVGLQDDCKNMFILHVETLEQLSGIISSRFLTSQNFSPLTW
jgi:hypothetical protein